MNIKLMNIKFLTMTSIFMLLSNMYGSVISKTYHALDGSQKCKPELYRYKDGLRRYVSMFNGAYAMQWFCSYHTDNEHGQDGDSKGRQGDEAFVEKVHFFKIKSHLFRDDKERLRSSNIPGGNCAMVEKDGHEYYQLRYKEPSLDDFARRVESGLPEHMKSILYLIEEWLGRKEREREKNQSDSSNSYGRFTVGAFRITSDVLTVYFGTDSGKLFALNIDGNADEPVPTEIDLVKEVPERNIIRELDIQAKDKDGMLDTTLYFISGENMYALSGVYFEQSGNSYACKYRIFHTLDSKIGKDVNVMAASHTIGGEDFVMVRPDGKPFKLFEIVSGRVCKKHEVPFKSACYIDNVALLDKQQGAGHNKELVIAASTGMLLCQLLVGKLSATDEHGCVRWLLEACLKKPDQADLVRRFVRLSLKEKVSGAEQEVPDDLSVSGESHGTATSKRSDFSWSTTSSALSATSGISKQSRSSLASMSSTGSAGTYSSMTSTYSHGSARTHDSMTSTFSDTSSTSGNIRVVLPDAPDKSLPAKDASVDDMALQSQDMSMSMQELLQVMDPTGATILHTAAAKGYDDLVKLFIDDKNLDAETLLKVLSTKEKARGNTPLHEAVYSGNPQALEYLLNNKGFSDKDLATLKTLGNKEGKNLANYVVELDLADEVADRLYELVMQI